MASIPKIPPTLWEVVWEQSQGGWNTTKIADWLKQVHDISISSRNVARLLEQLRAEKESERKIERDEEAAERRAVRGRVRDRMVVSLDLDLAALDAQGKRLGKVARQLYRKVRGDDLDQVTNYLRAEAELRKAVELRLKLAGADPEDAAAELAAAAAEVARRLGAEPAPAPADGGDPADCPDAATAGSAPLHLEILGPT